MALAANNPRHSEHSPPKTRSRASLLKRVAGSALLASAVLLGVPSAAAAKNVGSEVVVERTQATEPLPGQGLAAAVAAVPANSSELDALLARRKTLSDQQQKTQQDLTRTTENIQKVTLQREASAELVARRSEEISKAAETQKQLRGALRVIGVEWFITGFGRLSELNPAVSSQERERLDRARVLSESAATSTITKERAARLQLEELERQRLELQAQLVDNENSLQQLADESQSLSASLQQGVEQLAANEKLVAEARMSATINGTDLSTGALDAYWRAAASLQQSNPSCAIPWWAIAGVGRTESKHGTYRGASLGRDGVVSPPIFGPDLDGSNSSFAIIRDSDDGALDGTSATDRAVGPMQFLPSSWKAVARDATGDGVADPQNLYDAALTAGVYLCKKGPGLNQEGPLRAAYFSYNRSQRYVDIVMNQAFEYQRTVPMI